MMNPILEKNESSEVFKPLKLRVKYGSTPKPYVMGLAAWIEGEDEESRDFCRMVSEIEGTKSNSGSYGKIGFTVLGCRPMDQEAEVEMDAKIEKRRAELEQLLARLSQPGVRQTIQDMHCNVMTSRMVLEAEQKRIVAVMNGDQLDVSCEAFMSEIRGKVDAVNQDEAPDVPMPEGDGEAAR